MGDIFERKLHRAIKSGDARTVSWSILRGVDVNARDKHGSTALIAAAEHGRLDIAKLVLPYSDVDATNDAYGRTALMVAVSQNHLEVVKLLARVSNPLIEDMLGSTALDLALKNHGSAFPMDAIWPLLHEFDQKRVKTASKSPLITAASHGVDDAVAYLSRSIDDSPLCKSIRRRAARHAASGGHARCLRFLLAEEDFTDHELDKRDTFAVRLPRFATSSVSKVRSAIESFHSHLMEIRELEEVTKSSMAAPSDVAAGAVEGGGADKDSCLESTEAKRSSRAARL